MEFNFSDSCLNMRSSEIRNLMKYATRPDIISFSGGMPGNSLFPTEEIDEIYNNLPIDVKRAGFQYGATIGYQPLIESVKNHLRRKGLPVDDNELIITAGSLQSINIITKIFINPGDTILTEYPCFIGATGVFQSFIANLHGIPIDKDGIIIDELDKALKKFPDAKVLYITPYFHNPAGIIYSKERKAELLEYLKNKKIVILEDDCYGDLYFDDADKELCIPMKTIDPENPVICYSSSFSKILGPGMRLGWLLARPEIIAKCELAKQSTDACSSTFTQVIANEFLSQGKMYSYIERMRVEYKNRAVTMMKCLDEFMPPEVKWVKPRGGFYIWVELPEHIDSTEVLKETMKEGAVFVIGKAFDPYDKKNNCFRLAYSHTPPEQIRKGIEIIATVIKRLI